MGNVNLDEFNGVRSDIIDQGTPPPNITVSRNRTFIFGTARKGPRHTPVTANKENVEQIFGDVPLDGSFDTSLVRGFYEFYDAKQGKPDVALVRIGEVSSAVINLYEDQTYLSGILQPTYVSGTNAPSLSMTVRATLDGAEYNKTKVQIEPAVGPSGEVLTSPGYMTITLPDGTAASYNLTQVYGAPGAVSRVSDLVRLINANTDFTGKLVASYVPLERTLTLPITAASGTIPNTSYQLSQDESFGNKLVGITNAYIEDYVTETVDAGSTSFELAVMPDLTRKANPSSIDSFVRKADLELALTVTPAYVGQTGKEVSLYCSNLGAAWDESYSITGNTATYDTWSMEVYILRSGSATRSLLTLGTDYTVNTATGKITIVKSLVLGDRYYVNYRYKVRYSEASVRSDLTIGDDRSYFIYGDTIVFGAAQPADVVLIYYTKSYFDATDIAIENAADGLIEILDSSLIEVGDSLQLVVRYEPELPAPTGTAIKDAVGTTYAIQPGALSGGSDGRITSKKDYIKAVEKAMIAVDLYPRRQNIVMGMYLDDTTTGYNEETGLPETKPLMSFTKVLPYIERASRLTNECDISIPVRPLYDLTSDSIATWLTGLTDNSATDLARPANIIDSINNFRAHAPLGVFTIAIPEINGGRAYFANPATIYEAFRSDLSSSESGVHQFVPGNVKDLGVKIFNAELIAKLNTKRYTTAIVDYGNRFIWADTPTLALKYRSQYDRQFVRDTVYLAVGMAREAAQKYIGKPRLAMYLTSLKKDVGKALSTLVPDILSDVFVDILPVADGHITGRTRLRLVLTTAKEIRGIDIETTISLT